MERATLDLIHAGLGSYGDRFYPVSPPADAQMVAAEALLKPEALSASIEQAAVSLGTTNLRVAGSLWQKQYNAAVMMGTLAAMTLAGVGLDASLPNVSIVFRESMPRGVFLHDLSGTGVYPVRLPGSLRSLSHAGRVLESLGALHRLVFTALVKEHLLPLCDQLHQVAKLPRSISWGNAANLCADLYDHMASDPALRPAVLEDRLALMDSPVDPISHGRNPLFDRVRYVELDEPDLPPIVRVRRSCCQRYLLPNIKVCYTCSRLSETERVELMRELGMAERT